MPERKPYAPPQPYEDLEARRPETAETTIGDLDRTKRDPYAAFRFSGFVFYSIGNCISIAGRQMLTVAVEWEIYARTHSATALGLAGAAIATPVVLLSLPAGHMADRHRRKTIIIFTQAISAICSVLLALVSWKHLELPRLPILMFGNDVLRSIATVFERHATFQFDDLSLPLIYFLLFATTSARTFGWAARAAFLPLTVPREVFPNAATWNSSIFQLSCVVGPAAAGFLIVRAGFPFIYALESICALCFLFLVVPIKKIKQGARVTASAFHSLREGLRFVWNKKAILATITLDMFAVFLGGATALLPVFAEELCTAVRSVSAGYALRRPSAHRHGACRRLFATDAPRRKNLALVRDRFRNGHDRFRPFQIFLAVALDVVSYRRVRQREHDRAAHDSCNCLRRMKCADAFRP